MALPRILGRGDPKQRPLGIERPAIEKLNAVVVGLADAERHAAITQRKKIGTRLFLAQLVQRAPIMAGQMANCGQIVGLGSRCQPRQAPRSRLRSSASATVSLRAPFVQKSKPAPLRQPLERYPHTFCLAILSSPTAKPFSPTDEIRTRVRDRISSRNLPADRGRGTAAFHLVSSESASSLPVPSNHRATSGFLASPP